MTTLKISVASFSHDESNVTPDEFKAALNNAQLANDDPEDYIAQVNVFEIADSKDPRFYPWVGVSAKKSGVVAVVEVRQATQELILIAVLRQNLLFYDIHPLWNRRRSAR